MLWPLIWTVSRQFRWGVTSYVIWRIEKNYPWLSTNTPSYLELCQDYNYYFRYLCLPFHHLWAFWLCLKINIQMKGLKTCNEKYRQWKIQKTFNSLTTEKQTTKFSSANFQKMLSPCYIILRIQKLEGKQCRSRWGGSLWATSSRSTLFANSAIFVTGC